MMRVFEITTGCLRRNAAAESGPLPESAIWIDLNSPTQDEVKRTEALLKIVAPTREEMQEIEASSRVYHEDGGHFMTTSVVSRTETDSPDSSAVTFVLANDRLLTLRYSEPMPFNTFPARAERQPGLWTTAEGVLAGLLEAVIDRTADILERVSAEIDVLSKEAFGRTPSGANVDARELQDLLVRLGRANDISSKVRESLVGTGRVLTFLTQALEGRTSKELKAMLKTLARDVQSLSDHTTFLSSKVEFLLSAILGLINLDQNRVIKILSIAASVFLPPTLIASFYGMNFHNMPELSSDWGYPLATAAIILSGLLPFLFFKWRKWL